MAEKPDKSSYCLISGIFPADEANQILMSLILDKINFHHKSNWSHKERFGAADEHSVKRMKELNQTKADLAALIEEARSAGQQLRINCDIEITLAEDLSKGNTLPHS